MINFESNLLPLILHSFTVKNQSIPLVPWNSEQHLNLVYQPFVLLLHKLGFLLPDDTNKLWVRIPNFWTADILFRVADKLGPIDQSFLKFNLNHFNHIRKANDESQYVHETQSSSSSQFSVPRPHKVKSLIRYTPDLASTGNPSWLQELVPAVDELMDDDSESVDHIQAW